VVKRGGTASSGQTGAYRLADGTPILGAIARGIDVSHWQGDIDWHTVSQNDVSFVMLGTRYQGAEDPKFRQNALGAAQNGIKVGAYVYSYALDEAMALAEAEFILGVIRDVPISFPVALDLEDSSLNALTPQQISAIANAFCDRVQGAGYYAIIYANDYWLANRIDLSLLRYPVWVARYELKHTFENPIMWQATNTGSIPGITGNVDIDYLYRDISSLITPTGGTPGAGAAASGGADAYVPAGPGAVSGGADGQPAADGSTSAGASAAGGSSGAAEDSSAVAGDSSAVPGDSSAVPGDSSVAAGSSLAAAGSLPPSTSGDQTVTLEAPQASAQSGRSTGEIGPGIR
jgi:GH25 family lysozyme M1 (1,4-beta-N-acetylmuramidase)